MAIEYYDSVWDAIEDTPEEALNMRLRSELMRGAAGGNGYNRDGNVRHSE